MGGTCGTIAVLHALVNNLDSIDDDDIQSNSVLGRFKRSMPSFPGADDKEAGESRRRILQSSMYDCKELIEIHAGSTAPPGIRQGRHFVTFVCSTKRPRLVELDGRRKEGPIDHGSTSPCTFLADAAAVIRKRIALIQAENEDLLVKHSFAVLALVPKSN